MCCFSRGVDDVSGTRIFARGMSGGRQCVVYMMDFAASAELAMILPIPVARQAADDAVEFVDLSGYPDFFDALEQGFPPEEPHWEGWVGGAPALARARPRLEVHALGAFEASFVPTVSDFDRLDRRFQLPRTVWKALPVHRTYGFVVVKLASRPGGFSWLRRTRQETMHPLGFVFPRRDPARLFFPTLHVHDGEVHPLAHFDHELYTQGDTPPAEEQRWRATELPVSAFMDLKRAQGLLAGDRRCYARSIIGEWRNADVWLKV
jgi:hypothetical protein